MAFDDDEYSDKPVEEGETYEVDIEDLGSKGDGIARVDGFVVFVPDTEVGERVEIEINSVGRKFAFGDVVARLGRSDEDAPAEAEPAAAEPAEPADDEVELEPDEDAEAEPEQDDGMGSIDDQFGDIEEL